VPPQLLGEHYTPDSYRRAVARACQAAIDAGVEGAAHFTPYQLRHNCATEIANRENIELAQVLLGHRDIRTTAGYVKLWEKRAAAAALKYG
jgi:integrase